jgi:hypothetical protein
VLEDEGGVASPGSGWDGMGRDRDGAFGGRDNAIARVGHAME